MITKLSVLTVGHEACLINLKSSGSSDLPDVYDAWIVFRMGSENFSPSVTISIYLKYEFKMQNSIYYYLFETKTPKNILQFYLIDKGFSNKDITILSMNKTQKYLRY